MVEGIRNCKCSIHKSIKYIDPDEAPQGHIAVKGIGCNGCAFEHSDFKVCKKKKCMAIERKDNKDVIFKLK